MRNKILALGFAALLTAMVVFAACAALIARLLVEGDPKESNLPFVAFVPALIVAALLAWLGWRSTRWLRFAGIQIGVFAVLFVVLAALGL